MSAEPVEQGVILIVDDTPANLEVLFDLLTEAGYRISIAVDCETAIQTAEYATPDLILLDVMMPEIDGFETCRRLKANQQTQEIPVIFLTALTDTPDKVKGLALGAVDFLTKPLQEEEVLARIKLHLNLRNLTKRLQVQNLQLEQEIAERKRVEEQLQRQTAELIKREEALRETTQMLQAIVQASPLAILVLDPNGIVKMWNPAAQVMFGWSEAEVLDRPLPIVSESQQQEFWSLRQHVLQGETLTGWEVSRQKRDGTAIEISISAAPLRNAKGQITGIMSVLMNITDRKRSEHKIREQAALLDITTDAILVQDLNHQILFWNQGAEQIYGWRAEEAIGQNSTSLLKRERLSQMLEAQKSVLKHREWQGRLCQTTKDGRKIIVESRWTLMQDEQSNPKSILIVNTDITEKQHLEAQFLRAQRMQSIGTLAGGIAHDLNNLLTPILSSAQLLLMQPTLNEEKKQQLLRTIETSTRRGAALVKQVLAFARGVEGKRTAMQLRHLISEVKHIALETLPKTVAVQTEVASDLWMVPADATQLHQVLINLCINANDAMPDGGTLSIRATNFLVEQDYARMHLEAKVGAYVQITVTDTGSGIAPEIMDRIFEPFFTTKEFGKGTGLGLSTVHMIVRSHGGFVDVSSSVGQGTQVKVYLPAIQAVELSPHEEPEIPIGNGEVILVVDDEVAVREISQVSLEACNYKVLTARDGIEAVAIYTEHKDEINLVLVDMMMPSMDGAMAIRALRRIDPGAKIIAVSGLVSNTQMAEATRADIKAFLPKPYTTRDLLKAIKQVL